MRALILGHFSTVGDIESLEYVEHVLGTEGIAYDVLPYKPEIARSLPGAISLKALDPAAYTHLIVVCGPIWPELLERKGIALERFAHCTRIGVNLTMVLPVEKWDPFHLLIERDSDRTARPDITFMQETKPVPVVGLCTIARQKEYGPRQRHREAIGLMKGIVASRDVATIEVDTRWPASRNSGGLRSPAELLAVMSRLDLLLTNRLHGMVYALKAGVPVIAFDPVLGGDKVTAQAAMLGWPAVSTVENASPEWIAKTFAWCMSEEGRSRARSVAADARRTLEPTDRQLRSALRERFPTKPLPQTKHRGVFRRLIGALRD
ncbi:polysaccharide pyruvyl transferase family protein [Sphingomonas hankyongi]|uniref:Polysaccharide pyruvyl transferase family protein n=1 Tax=Sphingomonas hankyongi TaxID=2908209 RepID=A0ABT0S376_9SPHN|nr:polysaccharide pyruvyl transferase family protein [Sphingomonas hankyongi]MCL6730307.1 polysaccharide pyruvyl transferase family protein [Sphingomonas hankyongi]